MLASASYSSAGWAALGQPMVHDHTAAYIGHAIAPGPQISRVIFPRFDEDELTLAHPRETLGHWWSGPKNITAPRACFQHQICTFHVNLVAPNAWTSYHHARYHHGTRDTVLDVFYFARTRNGVKVSLTYAGPAERTLFFNRLQVAARQQPSFWSRPEPRVLSPRARHAVGLIGYLSQKLAFDIHTW